MDKIRCGMCTPTHKKNYKKRMHSVEYDTYKTSTLLKTEKYSVLGYKT